MTSYYFCTAPQHVLCGLATLQQHPYKIPPTQGLECQCRLSVVQSLGLSYPQGSTPRCSLLSCIKQLTGQAYPSLPRQPARERRSRQQYGLTVPAGAKRRLMSPRPAYKTHPIPTGYSLPAHSAIALRKQPELHWGRRTYDADGASFTPEAYRKRRPTMTRNKIVSSSLGTGGAPSSERPASQRGV